MVELIGVISFVATEVAKGAVGEAGKSLWQGVVSVYERWRGTKPEPTDIDEGTAQELLGNAPELRVLAQAYYEDSSALRRAQLIAPVLRGAKILWIDDHPEWNTLERQTLAEFDIVVIPVESTRSAIACLESESFDLVISDIVRAESATEGINALPALRAVGQGLAVIFYVGSVQGSVPTGAFGITAIPSELLHLCMDALERTRL
jgi:hypothetical protein